jgi:hypothetical protein
VCENFSKIEYSALKCVKVGENGIYSEGYYPSSDTVYFFKIIKCFHVENCVTKFITTNGLKINNFEKAKNNVVVGFMVGSFHIFHYFIIYKVDRIVKALKNLPNVKLNWYYFRGGQYLFMPQWGGIRSITTLH